MSNTLRLILTFVAVLLSFIVASPDMTTLDPSLRGVLAGIVAGLAAIGIFPPRRP